MKKSIVTILCFLVSVPAFGDGAVFFNNRIQGVVDARVLLPDGSGAGDGWVAQLYVGAAGASAAQLKPALPATTFRSTSSATLGYVTPVDVLVPGVAPGEGATVVMRVYNGASFESSLMRGESAPITVKVGGEMFPPANLEGLAGFKVGVNPSAFTLRASAAANGSVTPQEVMRVKGENQTFVASPHPNFAVDRWSVDGQVVQEGGVTFTLSNVQASHTVAVSFKIIVGEGGSITFNNRIAGVLDARVTHPNGIGVGAGWAAQLYAGPEGAPVAELRPLTPATRFRTESEAALGYVHQVEVSVPGVPPNARATVVMRAYEGASYETAAFRGESRPVTITLGGGLFPPANLIGLERFIVSGPQFSITAMAEAHGSIQPSGIFAKFAGESQSFVATPEAQYTVDQWFVNGAAVQTGGSTYTLSKISSDAKVSVTFKPAFVDGSVVFNNRVTGVVDARVLLANGRGAGAGWTAQLYGAAEGTATANLKPLFPATTFRTTSEATLGYVHPVDVKVPGVVPGAKATLVMRVYNGQTFETSSAKGESAPITVALGGGILPPTNLEGMQGFTLPEPPPIPSGTGAVNFQNRLAGVIDARVLLPTGMGAGAGWTAQLYGGPAGGKLSPLSPATKFRTSSVAVMGYVEPVVVGVPGIAPGSEATFVMTAYNGASLETSTMFGQSKPITIKAGGGIIPPTDLVGLEGFTVMSELPTILTQPVSQTVSAGSSVTFSVVAASSGPLTYQWSFNGSAVAGATSPSLVLENVKLSQAGSYSVTVRSPAGAVRSNAATLVVLSGETHGDFDGDGFADLLFQNKEGFLAVWFMEGSNLKSASYITPNNVRDERWRLVGTGRFNADAHHDLLFQHRKGTLAVWYMNGTARTSADFLDPLEPSDENWRVVATADFNRDQQVDLLLQHKDGTLVVWQMKGPKLLSAEFLSPRHPGDEDWKVVGTGDFNADSKVDIVFQHEDGTLGVWFMDGLKLTAASLLNPRHPRDDDWRVASIVDLNRDQKPDLVFQHEEGGWLAAWFMDGIQLSSARLLKPSRPGGSWEVVAP